MAKPNFRVQKQPPNAKAWTVVAPTLLSLDAAPRAARLFPVSGVLDRFLVRFESAPAEARVTLTLTAPDGSQRQAVRPVKRQPVVRIDEAFDVEAGTVLAVVVEGDVPAALVGACYVPQRGAWTEYGDAEQPVQA